MGLHPRAWMPVNIDITPNDTGLPGISALKTIVGAAMTVGLVLSVLALGGVAVSLVLQARESKANREHASRLIHTDLLKMAMDTSGSTLARCEPTHPKVAERGGFIRSSMKST